MERFLATNSRQLVHDIIFDNETDQNETKKFITTNYFHNDKLKIHECNDGECEARTAYVVTRNVIGSYQKHQPPHTLKRSLFILQFESSDWSV